MAIPNFFQSFCTRKVFINSECPFLAIPIYTSLLYQKGLNKFGIHIFGLSEFIYKSSWKKLLEKIQNSHFWPFYIYTSIFEKHCWKKFGAAIFGHSKFIPVFLRKIVGKIWNSLFLAIPNLDQSFWEKLSEKIKTGHFGHSKLYISLFGKNCWKKFGTSIFSHSKFIPVFWENCWKKFRMAIFCHSEFILVFLGNIVKRIQNGHLWYF